LPLPTYALWLNPIEKLWRKPKQEVLHLHTLSNDGKALRKSEVFLDQYRSGSPQLLRYVGLLLQ
jgi:transposase